MKRALVALVCSAACTPGASRPPIATVVAEAPQRGVREHHVAESARPRPPGDGDAKPAWFATPLGWKGFELVSLHGREELCRSYQFAVRVDVTEATIDDAALLGTLASVGVRTPSGMTYFSGYVSRVEAVHDGGQRDGPTRRTFDVTLVPWTWLLTKTANSAVFGEHDVPSVLQHLLDGRAFADYRMDLGNGFPESAFTVQYRETDQNFLQRLLEHVGLVTFFRHGPGGHELVLADDARKVAHEPTIPLDSKTADKVHTTSELVGSQYVLRASEPGASASVFEGSAGVASRYAFAGLEMYDIEGTAGSARDVEFYARLRAEEQQSSARRLVASVRDRPVRAGNVVNLTEFGALDGAYLVVAADIDVSTNGDDVTVVTDIETTPVGAPFRPQRLTAWPVIDGPQLATVVQTDRTRVEVRFQWTRGNAPSSDVWIPSLAAARGAHAGDTVVVDFLEGEPNRPIAVGVVAR
ncbi:MAG TPA: type VI secretion system tip protein TssI/VgrG [Polyangiaceae bacterium]|nr:type VI secretion system tip protein TssI/VgrG [Polyangiaceae bacterium]